MNTQRNRGEIAKNHGAEGNTALFRDLRRRNERRARTARLLDARGDAMPETEPRPAVPARRTGSRRVATG